MTKFLKEIKTQCSLEPKVFDPITGKMNTWINPHKLKDCYQKSSGCSIC
jgi:hypothetical protein